MGALKDLIGQQSIFAAVEKSAEAAVKVRAAVLLPHLVAGKLWQGGVLIELSFRYFAVFLFIARSFIRLCFVLVLFFLFLHFYVHH
jgi:hypothetical protein